MSGKGVVIIYGRGWWKGGHTMLVQAVIGGQNKKKHSLPFLRWGMF